MCQLLAMNGNVPTDIIFSFTGFALRGGRTDTHHDGWGIAFFEGAGVRHFVDHQAAVDSPVAKLIKRTPIKSRSVSAHIRKATQGRRAQGMFARRLSLDIALPHWRSDQL